MLIRSLLACLAIALGLAVTQPAKAQTVDEIISRGSINIGVLVDLPPYGILNAQQEPDGFDVDVAKLEDLKGLKVGVPRGTVQDVILTQTFGADIKLSRFDDDPSTYQALLTGQVDAIAETGLTGDVFFAQNPGPGIERKFTLLQQPNGITMRKDQWNLHQWVNTFVYFVKNNGELNAIHEKWFKKPLPPLPTF